MPLNKDILITPPNRGIPVYFTDNIRDKALTLLQAEKERYYYAVMAMKHLRALSSGLMGKDNVFIPNIKDFKTNSFQHVVVYVPGIKANVERRADGGLRVTDLVLDDNYYKSIAHKSNNKPGVYVVSKRGAQVVATYKKNGRVTPENNRSVVIASTEYSSPKEAAETVWDNLEHTQSDAVEAYGKFDMFYSSVGKKLNGMRNYTPEVVTDSYAFAGLLADAMEKSTKQEGVVWGSEFSGSTVLSQALLTLANKGVSFKGKGHYVKMYRPTTNPASILQATNKLGIKADKKLGKGNGNWRASTHLLLINAKRAWNSEDHYTGRDYVNDISGGAFTAFAIGGTLAFAGTSIASTPLFTFVGGVCGAAGLSQLAYNTISNRIKSR